MSWLQASSRLEDHQGWKAAVAWMQEGITIAPKEARGSLYLRLGFLYFSQHNSEGYHTAILNFTHAIENGGWLYALDEVSSHTLRGQAYRMLKAEYGPDPALKDFRTVLDLQPDNDLALILIGEVYLSDFKDGDRAEQYFRRALTINSIRPDTYAYIGDVYRGRGEKEEAAGWYRQALEYRPGWQSALDRLNHLDGK